MTNSDSADVARQQKGTVARVFGSVASDYDQSGVEFFGLFARSLVHALAPEPGWHVVDVGAGRGAVVFPLAEALGPQGKVTALDLAEPMVAALRADLAARGITTVDARLGDIDTLELPPGAADAVTASMVLFFLPDPGLGLAAIRRVLRPGGRLALTVFGDPDPEWREVYDAFLPFLPEAQREEDLSRPRHPQLATEDDLRRTVGAAGFTDVECRHEVHPVRFASVEQWHTWSWSIGLRGSWLQIPEELRDAARTAVLDAVEARRRPDGSLVEDFGVHLVLARKPTGTAS
jgi:ubiquinone/menaquinone biosynthesis C-methylase UbiE